jgi:hypothetical protein
MFKFSFFLLNIIKNKFKKINLHKKMNIKEAFLSIKNTIPENIVLVAVSKTKPIEDIQEIYNLGHKIFGENKVQELVDKYNKLPKDIEWHMIGHLQSNKVKYIAPFVSLIHSIDSLKLLKEVNKRAAQNDRIIDCLFECHIAKEETKFGLSKDELMQILDNEQFKTLSNIRIRGLMGIATNTSDQNIIKQEFRYLKQLFDLIKFNYFSDNEYFTEISMGMSNDYKLAIEEGATIIRVGSLIFGKRIY